MAGTATPEASRECHAQSITVLFVIMSIALSLHIFPLLAQVYDDFRNRSLDLLASFSELYPPLLLLTASLTAVLIFIGCIHGLTLGELLFPPETGLAHISRQHDRQADGLVSRAALTKGAVAKQSVV